MNQNEEEEVRNITPKNEKGCWYPMWEGDTPTHIYCDEPREEGSSYCSHHHSIVYIAGSNGRIKIPSYIK